MKAFKVTRCALFAILTFAAPVALGQDMTEECMECHGDDPDMTLAFADGAEVSAFVDLKAFRASAHGGEEEGCAACHRGIDLDDHGEADLPARREYAFRAAKLCTECHEEEAEEHAKGYHGQLLADGEERAATCVDCHDPHTMSSETPTRAQIARSCAACHEEPYEQWAEGVHGRGVLTDGNPDLPICVDCHGAHETSEATSMSFRLSSLDLCSKCHGDAELAAKYELSPHVVQTYLEDFHGVSVSYSRKEGTGEEARVAATCVDCHGVHAIHDSDEDGSVAMKANLAEACGECHEGATPEFSAAWLSHYVPGPRTAPLVFFAKLLYWVFIPFVIVGLLIHVAMNILLYVNSRRLGAPPASWRPRGAKRPATAVRFGWVQRFEHWIVMVSFLALAITGICQKFHDNSIAEWLIMAMGGMEFTRTLHRGVALAFTAVAVHHLVWNFLGPVVWGRAAPMLGSRKDFADAIQDIRHSFDPTRPAPRADRFDYRQKFEYWGMVLGSVVMIATGFVLWFPLILAQVVPGQLIPVSKVIHSNEAMLALLVVVVWHMYSGHLEPHHFPADTSIFTGKISVERMQKEHPLEYERLVAAGELPAEATLELPAEATLESTDAEARAPQAVHHEPGRAPQAVHHEP